MESKDNTSGTDQLKLSASEEITITGNRSPEILNELKPSQIVSKTEQFQQRKYNLTRLNSPLRTNNNTGTGMTRRCVCNLSQCASTNYMCKSEGYVYEDGMKREPGCFIEDLDAVKGDTEISSSTVKSISESNRGRPSAKRGCIEMLSREKQGLCRSKVGAPIQCCFNEDMCNYPKTFYPPVSPLQNSNFGNVGVGGGPISTTNGRIPFEPAGVGGRGGIPPNLDHQVWLRAAVIAVPVCGLMILMALIYVARRLLSGEDDYKTSTGTLSHIGYNNRKSPYHQRLYQSNPSNCELLLPSGLEFHHHPYHWCSFQRPPASYLLPHHQPNGSIGTGTESLDSDPLFPSNSLSVCNYFHNMDHQLQVETPIPTNPSQLPQLNINETEKKGKFEFLKNFKTRI